MKQTYFDVLRMDKMEYLELIREAGIGNEDEQQTMLKAMYDSSYVWQGRIYGNLIGLMGVVPSTIIGDSAYIWLFATENFKKHSFIAARHSKRIIEEILKVYPVLYGHCEVGEYNSRRWIKFLGARFGPAHGVLIPFEIRAHS